MEKREEKANTFEKNKSVAKRGGGVAGSARKETEAQTGKPLLTQKTLLIFHSLLQV